MSLVIVLAIIAMSTRKPLRLAVVESWPLVTVAALVTAAEIWAGSQ